MVAFPFVWECWKLFCGSQERSLLNIETYVGQYS
jgi:hypothetical protein